MRFSTLPAWLDWQRQLNPRAIELGLDRIGAVARKMGLDQPGFPLLTVAGTNGKGSSVTMADAILRAAGRRCGRFTSPHLLRYEERIAVDGEEITEEALCQVFARVDEAREEISLTEFEFSALAAMDYFRQRQVDIAVLEVGLGGRLDAVNAFSPTVALITALDLDHQDWLGADRNGIGREKAGIMRPGIPVVCSDPAPPPSIQEHADQIGARLAQAGRDFSWEVQASGWRWQYHFLDWSLPAPGLAGKHQYQNAAGVLAALTHLPWPITESMAARGLQNAKLPGRMQPLAQGRGYLDVAHNPQAASALAEMLPPLPERTLGVVGMLETKDLENTLRPLLSRIQSWYLAELPVPNSATRAAWENAAKALALPNACVFASLEAAYAQAIEDWREGDRLLVFGSFITVAEVQRMEARPVNIESRKANGHEN